MAAATELAAEVGIAPACAALGIPRASYYRNRAPLHGPAPARHGQARALTPDEREAILAQLYRPRFRDWSPAQVCPTLIDEGLYLCAPRSMYRLLSIHREFKLYAVQHGLSMVDLLQKSFRLLIKARGH